jgi:hypothetical protein
MFSASPFLWTAIVAAYVLVAATGYRIPYAGTLLVHALLPVMAVGIMNGCRAVLARQPLRLMHLFSALSPGFLPLARLGLLELALSLVLWALAALVDGGAMFRALFVAPQEDETIHVTPLFAVVTLAHLPLLMAMWFAPALVAWQAMPAAKAMFFSFFAVWHNLRAFLVFAVALVATAALIPTLFISAIATLAPEAAAAMARGFLIALMFFVLPIAFAANYLSYCDLFGGDGEAVR